MLRSRSGFRFWAGGVTVAVQLALNSTGGSAQDAVLEEIWRYDTGG